MQCQFELWEECNSQCEFCYLAENNRCTPDDIKKTNLEKTIEKINDMDFLKNENITCLAYIGGEFFQGQLENEDVRYLFMKLMKDTNHLLEERKIDEVWISATMTIGNQEDLFQTVGLFSDPSKVWVLTSYDTIGRFHTTKMRETWLNNLSRLRDKFPNLKINITSIITGDFIDRYMNNSLDLPSIAEKYKCSMFLKPTCSTDRLNERDSKQETNRRIPNFFPTRKQFMQFLMKYKVNESSYMYDKLFNMNMRSDYLYKYSNGFKKSHRIKDKFQEDMDGNTEVLKCGHSSQYNIYLDDKEHCAVCDKETIRNMV